MKDDEGDGDGGEESELKRSSRNLNEKKRRDRFNVLVQEVAGIVLPENERKLDKTTVLKRAINFLQNHQSHFRSAPRPSRHTASKKWQPSFVTDGELNLIMLEASNSFTLAIESNGNITFASHSVLSLLGYRPEEMQNTSLLAYLHEEDALRILPQLSSIQKKTFPSECESFQLRIKCGNFCSKNTYQVVECKATFISEQNCIVVVGKVYYPQPNKVVVTSDSQCKQFSYRLSMDWKYVYLDHRASSIIGFLPFELLGTSFYDYCSPEEVFNISQYHKILIGRGKVTTCYYRHLTKGQSWVWLQSSCYISYNQWNSKPELTTCTASVVHFDEVCANQSKIIQRDKEHFKKFFSDGESESISTSLGHGHSTSSLCTLEEPAEQQIDFIPQDSADEAASSSEQGKNSKASFSPGLLNCLIKTPSDQLIEILSTQSEMDPEEEVKSSELEWLDNIKIPSGLSSMQLTTHFKLVKEYQKIAEQIRKQERQLRMIRKLIEWSSLLLEFDRNFTVTGDSSADSISVTSSYDS